MENPNTKNISSLKKEENKELQNDTSSNVSKARSLTVFKSQKNQQASTSPKHPAPTKSTVNESSVVKKVPKEKNKKGEFVVTSQNAPYVFSEALKEKYLIEQNLDPKICSAIGKNKTEKVTPHQLPFPTTIDLCCRKLRWAGEVAQFSDSFKKVDSLNLSANAFDSWKEIFKMTSLMPSLAFLSLGTNPLSDSDFLSEIETFQKSHNVSWVLSPDINQLILNATDLSWLTIKQIIRKLPRLKSLHLSGIKLSQFEQMDNEKFDSIEDLNLSHNFISDWKEINKLNTQMPNLKNLVLTKNPIKNIDIPSVNFQNKENYFIKLESLSLDETQIQSLDQTADQLNKLNNLKNLRLRNTLILKNEKEDLRRKIMISKFEKVLKLNGSAVTQFERQEAELFNKNKKISKEKND